MKLSDLLDELRSNILNDRGLSTGASDKLWSDTTLVRYINESQRRFARRGLVIRDATTPEVVQVKLQTSVDEYLLHPSIIAVMSARLTGEVRDLARTSHNVLNVTPQTTDNWDMSLATTIAPNKPVAFTTDEQLTEDDDGTISTVTLKLFPAPSSDYNNVILNLRVVRMPLDDLTTSNLSAVPEIPADHHLDMLDWAAYLALRIVDEDAGDPVRAKEFAQAFETHVQEARTLVMKKLFAPQPWGFGRNGWAWRG